MTPTENTWRLGGVILDHPTARQRTLGERSKARLQLWTQSGRDRSVALSEDDLIRLLNDASTALAILRGRH